MALLGLLWSIRILCPEPDFKKAGCPCLVVRVVLIIFSKWPEIPHLWDSIRLRIQNKSLLTCRYPTKGLERGILTLGNWLTRELPPRHFSLDQLYLRVEEWLNETLGAKPLWRMEPYKKRNRLGEACSRRMLGKGEGQREDSDVQKRGRRLARKSSSVTT